MQRVDASLANYYSARAREYEQIYSKPERQPDIEQLQNLLPRHFAGRRVLEVACGTGYWTQFLIREANSIVGVDASDETLDIASEKAWPPGRVTFRTGDAYALPQDLGTFDAAFGGFWWSHIPARDRRTFLSSLDQRLNVGATVVLLDNLFVEGNSTPIAYRDADGNTYQRRRLNDGSKHIVLKNFPAEDELRKDVDAFGHNVQFTSLRYYWLLCYEKR